MFSTSGLFKNTPCPGGPTQCKLANCIFSHEPRVAPAASQENATPQATVSVGDENGDLKRRKLGETSMARIQAEYERGQTTKKPSPNPKASPPAVVNNALRGDTTKPLKSSLRSISPPPPTAQRKNAPVPASAAKPAANGASTAAKKAPEKTESLNPRLVPRNSTPHTTRSVLLKKIHAEFVRLNNEVRKSKDEKVSSLKLPNNKLVLMALDLEEDTVKKQPGVYPQVMKNKLVRYMKMPLKDWVVERQKTVDEEEVRINGTAASKLSNSNGVIKLDTGLSHEEELKMLERFILSPQHMAKAGIILTPPSEAQIADAQKIIQASGGYETCDRCGSRFQVLAEPKEDGSYTTNGKCVHHWGRPVFPKREKTDFATGPKETYYSCCNQPKGSQGCTTMASHVFKIGGVNAGRLASVLQFETTPLNTKAERIAVAFDCEMGYTTAGLELIRLSACKWPSNESLIDVLVKPIGDILDLNTNFSGVTPRQFIDAIPFDAEKHVPLPGTVEDRDENGKTTKKQVLKIMSSPAAARALLTSYISPATVLIGHAIDNDLNVVRLVHPTIVDTSLLFPHHSGLPYRFPLRKLAKDFLNLDIQTAGAAGHDSMEDSRATGDLVRYKVMREWSKLTGQGWSVENGKFYATIGREKKAATLPPYTESQGLSKKRKAEEEANTAGLKVLLGYREDSQSSKL